MEWAHLSPESSGISCDWPATQATWAQAAAQPGPGRREAEICSARSPWANDQATRLGILLPHNSAGATWGSFKNKCCNNPLVMIYNSNMASKPTAAKSPAFYWKQQAQGPRRLLPWHRCKPSISADRKVTYQNPRPCSLPAQSVDSRSQPVVLKGPGPALPGRVCPN